jgi:hypothetical protein
LLGPPGELGLFARPYRRGLATVQQAAEQPEVELRLPPMLVEAAGDAGDNTRSLQDVSA